MRLLPFIATLLTSAALFAAETFEADGHKAVIQPAAKRAGGKRWLGYAPALKGGVAIGQHKLYADACQQAGIAIAGYDRGERRGAPEGAAEFTKFYDGMVKRG